MPKPPLRVQATTLWEYPSQNYGGGTQGDTAYAGATPSWIVWNLLVRYTRKGDLVVDPMAGSGTTLDVARDLARRGLGYDIAPPRKDVFRADARKLPLETGKADFAFVDPPYSDHLTYSGAPACIGELRADSPDYYVEMGKVIAEIDRVLRPGRYLALYVSDSFKKGRPFMPIGPRLFDALCERFTPVDVVAVVRHNAKLKRGHWHAAAVDGNFFLRGFNYLFIMFKEDPARPRQGRDLPDRRDPEEVAALLGREKEGT
jgi:DNA modification methylase